MYRDNRAFSKTVIFTFRHADCSDRLQKKEMALRDQFLSLSALHCLWDDGMTNSPELARILREASLVFPHRFEESIDQLLDGIEFLFARMAHLKIALPEKQKRGGWARMCSKTCNAAKTELA